MTRHLSCWRGAAHRCTVLSTCSPGTPLPGAELLARRTPGFSGAELANLVNESALLAARHDSDAITTQVDASVTARFWRLLPPKLPEGPARPPFTPCTILTALACPPSFCPPQLLDEARDKILMGTPRAITQVGAGRRALGQRLAGLGAMGHPRRGRSPRCGVQAGCIMLHSLQHGEARAHVTAHSTCVCAFHRSTLHAPVQSEEARKLTAYHEGGHALVALYTPGAKPIHKVGGSRPWMYGLHFKWSCCQVRGVPCPPQLPIRAALHSIMHPRLPSHLPSTLHSSTSHPPSMQATIVPRGHALGMVSQVPDKDEYSVTRQQMLAQIDVCMGGKAAEELIFGAPAFWVAHGFLPRRPALRMASCCGGLGLVGCSFETAAKWLWIPSCLFDPAVTAKPPIPYHAAGEEHVTSGATSDLKQATRLARHMVVDCGMSDRIGPGGQWGRFLLGVRCATSHVC